MLVTHHCVHKQLPQRVSRYLIHTMTNCRVTRQVGPTSITLWQGSLPDQPYWEVASASIHFATPPNAHR